MNDATTRRDLPAAAASQTRFEGRWSPLTRLRRPGGTDRVRAGTSGMHAIFRRATQARTRVSMDNLTHHFETSSTDSIGLTAEPCGSVSSLWGRVN